MYVCNCNYAQIHLIEMMMFYKVIPLSCLTTVVLPSGGDTSYIAAQGNNIFSISIVVEMFQWRVTWYLSV
jgi:uncharacterized FlgJ-related protein